METHNTIKRKKTSFTMTEPAYDMLGELSGRMGISRSSVLEILIRDRINMERQRTAQQKQGDDSE